MTDEMDLSGIKIVPDAMRLADFEKRRAGRVQPALTAEEWVVASEHWRSLVAEAACTSDLVKDLDDVRGSQAIAALCLYRQPAGFTREDVKFLTDEYLSLMTVKAGWPPSSHAQRLKSIIDRIEALLPPEST